MGWGWGDYLSLFKRVPTHSSRARAAQLRYSLFCARALDTCARAFAHAHAHTSAAALFIPSLPPNPHTPPNPTPFFLSH